MSENAEDSAAGEPAVEALEEGVDPFSPENAPMMNFIMQARIYDVLMSLLTTENAALARELLAVHSQGAIVGPMPKFNGNFITDELNASDI